MESGDKKRSGNDEQDDENTLSPPEPKIARIEPPAEIDGTEEISLADFHALFDESFNDEEDKSITPVEPDVMAKNGALFDRIFEIDLIFEKIQPMLSYQDLKSCRLVRRSCNFNIMRRTGPKYFISRTTVVVSEKMIRDKMLERLSFVPTSLTVRRFPARLAEERHDLENSAAPGPSKRAQPIPGWKAEDLLPFYEFCSGINAIKFEDPQGGTIACALTSYASIFPSIEKTVIAAGDSLKKLWIHQPEGGHHYCVTKAGCLSSVREDAEFGASNLRHLELHGRSCMLQNLGFLMGTSSLETIRVILMDCSGKAFKGNARFSAVLAASEGKRLISRLILDNKRMLQTLAIKWPMQYRFEDILTATSDQSTSFPGLRTLEIGFTVKSSRQLQNFLDRHIDHLKTLELYFYGYLSNDIPQHLRDFFKTDSAQKLKHFRVLNEINSVVLLPREAADDVVHIPIYWAWNYLDEFDDFLDEYEHERSDNSDLGSRSGSENERDEDYEI